VRDMRGLETIMEIQHLLLGHFPTVPPHQVHILQGYLAHKKQHPPGTLQYDYA
jgi:hypothetical protein